MQRHRPSSPGKDVLFSTRGDEPRPPRPSATSARYLRLRRPTRSSGTFDRTRPARLNERWAASPSIWPLSVRPVIFRNAANEQQRRARSATPARSLHCTKSCSASSLDQTDDSNVATAWPCEKGIFSRPATFANASRSSGSLEFVPRNPPPTMMKPSFDRDTSPAPPAPSPAAARAAQNVPVRGSAPFARRLVSRHGARCRVGSRRCGTLKSLG